MKIQKVKEVYPLLFEGNRLLAVVFENLIKIYDMNQLINEEPYTELVNDSIFALAQVDCGGSAVCWNSDIDLCEFELWENGRGITEDEYLRFIVAKMVYIRNHKNISQRELASLSGVAQPVIARIESNKVSPKLDTIIKLTNALDVKLDIIT